MPHCGSAAKAVIHAWVPTAANMPQTETANFWGIGDLARGSQVLCAVCEELGVPFFVDMRGHPLGGLFRGSDDLPDLAIDYTNIDFHAFRDRAAAIAHLRQSLETQDVVVIASNGWGVWDDTISPTCRAFMHRVLEPTALLTEQGAQPLPPAGSYDVLHFRLGDRELTGRAGRLPTKALLNALTVLREHLRPEDIVLTDSARLKALAGRLYGARVTRFNPVHTGLLSRPEAGFGTAVEFLMTMRARRIRSYSVYGSRSGFVKVAGHLYGVPVEDLSRRHGLITALLRGRELLRIAMLGLFRRAA